MWFCTAMVAGALLSATAQDLLTASVLDEPLSQEIVRRESYVRSLQAEISRLNQLKTDRQQDRDLAWQGYNNLLSKEQELKIAARGKVR